MGKKTRREISPGDVGVALCAITAMVFGPAIIGSLVLSLSNALLEYVQTIYVQSFIQLGSSISTGFCAPWIIGALSLTMFSGIKKLLR